MEEKGEGNSGSQQVQDMLQQRALGSDLRESQLRGENKHVYWEMPLGNVFHEAAEFEW